MNLKRLGDCPFFWQVRQNLFSRSIVSRWTLWFDLCKRLYRRSADGWPNLRWSWRRSSSDRKQSEDLKTILSRKNAWPNLLMTGNFLSFCIKTLLRLSSCTCNRSISLKIRRKGISASTTWNSMAPIGVSSVTEPIEDVDPIPNWTFTIPAFVLIYHFLVSLSIFLKNFWN